MSTDHVIRLAGPEHLGQLPAIESAAATRFGDSLPLSVLSHVTPADTLEAAQLAGLLWVALEPAGSPVGFAVASTHGRRVHLEELDVLPEHGREGVGSALIKAVEDHALKNGCTQITLTTFGDVPWNAPFYASIGFEVIPEYELDTDLLRRLAEEAELGLDRSRRVAMCKPLSNHRPPAKPCMSRLEASMEKVNIGEKLSSLTEHWSPRIVSELNGQHVKLAKLKGEFTWHHHDDEDEMFFVVKGRLTIRFPDEDVVLDEGEFLVIPRGVEHLPVALDEVHVLLFEPAGTLNTGNVRNEFTIDRPELA